jgi:hypothetical protein
MPRMTDEQLVAMGKVRVPNGLFGTKIVTKRRAAALKRAEERRKKGRLKRAAKKAIKKRARKLKRNAIKKAKKAIRPKKGKSKGKPMGFGLYW